MEDNKSVMMLVGAFVAIIIGISLLGVIASEGNKITDINNISGETVDYSSAREDGTGLIEPNNFTIANPPTTWRTTQCPIEGFVLYNSSGVLTDSVDYTFTASSGVIAFENTDNVNGSASNTTSATYQYCSGAYLTQGWTRTIIDLVPGFFALGLLGVGVGLFYSVGSREGVW